MEGNVKKIILALCVLFLLSCSRNWTSQDNVARNYSVSAHALCEFIGGLNPERETLYDLCWFRVTQKIDGGYLLISAGPYPGIPVVLYTDQGFRQGQFFDPRLFFGYYVGDVSYNTIMGFKNNVHAFRLLPPS